MRSCYWVLFIILSIEIYFRYLPLNTFWWYIGSKVIATHSFNNTREDSIHIHEHRHVVNTEIRLIIFFAAKDGEALYSQLKQDWKLTMAQIMNSFLPSSVQFSLSVMSDSLRTHESQHTRPTCPSPTPRVYPSLCPLSQ